MMFGDQVIVKSWDSEECEVISFGTLGHISPDGRTAEVEFERTGEVRVVSMDRICLLSDYDEDEVGPYEAELWEEWEEEEAYTAMQQAVGW